MRIALSSDHEGQVFLYLDGQGRDALVAELRALEVPKDQSSHEHFHMMTEHWGVGSLDALSEGVLNHTQQKLVHHLKVLMRPSVDDTWANDVPGEEG